MDTNNDMIKILEIYPSDILAESMRKINWNFNAIIGKNNATDFKLLALAQSLKDRIDALERGGASRDNDIARNLDALNEKFNGLDTSEDIKNAIDEALANANLDIQNFIITHVEDTVSHKYGDYVTTSYYERDKSAMDGRINGLSGDLDDMNREVIRISSAFDEWTADAVTGTASASRIVANATFYKNEDGYLVYINPTDDNMDPPAPFRRPRLLSGLSILKCHKLNSGSVRMLLDLIFWHLSIQRRDLSLPLFWDMPMNIKVSLV